MLRSQIEDKIPDISNLATNTTLNADKNVFKKEIPRLTDLRTTTVLNAKINGVKNKYLTLLTKLPLLLLLLLKIKYLILEIRSKKLLQHKYL